jgi:hypothetical protein
MNLNSVRDRIREVFFLEKAQETSARLTDSQRAAVRACSDAAVCRLGVARDIRGTAQTPAALELYRQGFFFYALAFFASRDRTFEVGSLAPESTLTRLEQALAAEGASPPAELSRAKPFLLAADPLAADRLPSDQAEEQAQALEVTTRWMSRLFDVRSPKELRLARFVRLGIAGASAAALLVLFVMWVFAPKDLAKGRPAVCSGATMFSTVPAGAVDGSKSGQYGFHSALEDSPWLSVDLGTRYKVNTVKVYGRGDGYYDQSIPLALELSEDGTNYHQVAERAEPFSSSDPWVVKSVGQVAQFVRVHTLRHSYLVLGELEVYGQKPK